MAREYGAAARVASKDGGRFSGTGPPVRYPIVTPDLVSGAQTTWLSVFDRVGRRHGLADELREQLGREYINEFLVGAGWRPAGTVDQDVHVKTGGKFR